jgi:hypothetical protein
LHALLASEVIPPGSPRRTIPRAYVFLDSHLRLPLAAAICAAKRRAVVLRFELSLFSNIASFFLRHFVVCCIELVSHSTLAAARHIVRP